MTENEYIEQAEKNGISYNNYFKRVFYYGWDKERASTTPIMTKSEAGKLGNAKPRVRKV